MRHNAELMYDSKNTFQSRSVNNLASISLTQWCDWYCSHWISAFLCTQEKQGKNGVLTFWIIIHSVFFNRVLLFTDVIRIYSINIHKTKAFHSEVLVKVQKRFLFAIINTRKIEALSCFFAAALVQLLFSKSLQRWPNNTKPLVSWYRKQAPLLFLH